MNFTVTQLELAAVDRIKASLVVKESVRFNERPICGIDTRPEPPQRTTFTENWNY